jgi:hypothetical protein
MEDVPINALKELAQTAVAAALANCKLAGSPVNVKPRSPAPRCDSPPLRIRLPPNARLGAGHATKRQRVAPGPEVEEAEVEAAPVAESDAVQLAKPAVATPNQAQSRSPKQTPQRPRYLSVAAAATETGLPKAVVKSWATQGLMDTLKPGSDNSHRLVEMGDLMRFVELKREIARADLRKKLEEEQAERLAADSQDNEEEEQKSGDKTLVYLRVPEEELPAAEPQTPESDVDPEDLTPQQIHALGVKLQQLMNATGFNNRKTCLSVGEVGPADDLNRTGFEEVIAKIIGRKINRLALAYPGQICNAGAWPLFKWLCDAFDVAIVCLRQTESIESIPPCSLFFFSSLLTD